MGIFIKASVATIAAYFAAAAYDYYGRDSLEPTPFISAFPPVAVLGKSVVGIGYDGKTLTGFEEQSAAIQWEINKGNNDEAYKKKLIAAGFRILSGYSKEFYMNALPQGYKKDILNSEISKRTPAQESAGFALMNQIISLQKDEEIREVLGMRKPSNP